jgi:hypothetical protein
MDSLSPQHIPHKPITVLQVACKHCNNMLKIKFCLLAVGEEFFLHYYANTIHILHMRFYISKMPLLLEIALETPTRTVQLV